MGFVKLLSRLATLSNPRIQVDGAERVTDEDGRLAISGSAAWLFSHTAEPGDAVVVARLFARCPRPADGNGPIAPQVFIRKGPPVEQLVTKAIAGRFFTVLETDTSNAQVAASKRQENNRARLAGARKPLERGDQFILFPQGTVRGPGLISIAKDGAVRACARRDERAVPLIPVALTYEALTSGTQRPIVHIGAPLILESAALAEGSGEVRRKSIERALARLNSVTISGVIGAYLLAARDAAGGAVVLDQATMERIVTEAAKAAAAQGMSVDRKLTAPGRRAEAIRHAHDELHRRGYLDEQQRLVLDALGPREDPTRTPLSKEELTRSRELHEKDPLRYWGNRTLQQAYWSHEAKTILETAFGLKLPPCAPGETPEKAAPAPETCRIM